MRTKTISPYVFPGLSAKQHSTFTRQPIYGLTYAQVLYAVCNRTGISIEQIQKPTRARAIADARALAVYLAHKHIDASSLNFTKRYLRIDRHRTTCIAMLRKVQNFINTYEEYALMVSKLQDTLHELTTYAQAA